MERPATSGEIGRLLEEQVGYYEARAAEYEDCYLRRGRYDHGPDANAVWFEETARLEAAAQRFDASGTVLEIACGTGLWTRFLAPRATHLLAVDAAASVIELNRARYGGPNVDYQQVDIFDWAPPAGERFDAIFFGFFISHVPPALFESFWSNLRDWLAPGGHVFFCDDAAGSDRPFGGDRIEQAPGYALRRSLTDGQEFTIVKIFYEETELTRRLAELGWQADVTTTGSLFMHGTASPRV
jgi:demethylmenaquinone methyltransferase/2-methoxy-6-polyprenyl-1,4-benzoquinol methylase